MPVSKLFFLPQIELKAGKGAGERTGPEWKAALQREREEQQHLLAESYSAVMELTRQLQVSERNWSQEKLQLVERLQGEKQQVEQQVKELQNRLSQVRPVPAQATRGSVCRKRPGVGAPSGMAGSRCSENTVGTGSFSLPVSQICFPLCFFLSKLPSNMATVSFVLISSQLSDCSGKTCLSLQGSDWLGVSHVPIPGACQNPGIKREEPRVGPHGKIGVLRPERGR